MTDHVDPSIGVSVNHRYAKLVGLAVLVGCLVCLAMVFEQLLRLTGYWPPSRLDTATIVGVVAAIGLARRAAEWSWVHPLFRSKLRRWVERSDDFAAWALAENRPTLAISLVIAILLISWAPHYLTWPFWTDHDVIATLAIGWDRGQLPWRDQFGFQFPGEIEIFWLLGRGLGWGSSLAFYATDLALLGVLLATVSVSCRACLGRWLPGLMASLAILSYYVTLSFTRVAQRDWHAAELAVVSLMLLVSGSSWRLRLASSLVYAIALTIRPHAIVFLPALGLALLVPPRGDSGGRSAVAVWLGGLGTGLLVTFSPVVLSGLGGDFLSSMRLASSLGGPYAEASLSRFWRILMIEIKHEWNLTLAASLLVFAWIGASQQSRRLSASLLVAMACAILYRPLHPVDHGYLTQPLILFQALALAAIVDGLGTFPLRAPARLAAFLLLIDITIPWWTPNCNVRASFAAISALANRTDLTESPPGCENGYFHDKHPAYPYEWKDYLAALDYLRTHTDSATPVANLLTYFPYPSMNAAVGRITPLPIETICLISWFPDADFDAKIAPALEASNDALVVCDANHPEENLARRLKLTRATLDRSYTAVARFGKIEIRRRSPRKDRRPTEPDSGRS